MYKYCTYLSEITIHYMEILLSNMTLDTVHNIKFFSIELFQLWPFHNVVRGVQGLFQFNPLILSRSEFELIEVKQCYFCVVFIKKQELAPIDQNSQRCHLLLLQLCRHVAFLHYIRFYSLQIF